MSHSHQDKHLHKSTGQPSTYLGQEEQPQYASERIDQESGGSGESREMKARVKMMKTEIHILISFFQGYIYT